MAYIRGYRAKEGGGGRFLAFFGHFWPKRQKNPEEKHPPSFWGERDVWGSPGRAAGPFLGIFGGFLDPILDPFSNLFYITFITCIT